MSKQRSFKLSGVDVDMALKTKKMNDQSRALHVNYKDKIKQLNEDLQEIELISKNYALKYNFKSLIEANHVDDSYYNLAQELNEKVEALKNRVLKDYCSADHNENSKNKDIEKISEQIKDYTKSLSYDNIYQIPDKLNNFRV